MFNYTNGPNGLVHQILADAANIVKTEAAAAPKLTVETINNHVYFYADVDTDRTLAAIRTLRDLDAMLRNERLTRAIPDKHPHTPIWLHIQSDGGSLFAALSMVDQLQAFKTPIYSIVEGVCASAATLIAMACPKRYMLPRSFMLIHQLSSFAWGKYQDIKDNVELLDKLMAQLADFYTSRSDLTPEQVKGMLQHDTWLSADQCLENGMIDHIVVP